MLRRLMCASTLALFTGIPISAQTGAHGALTSSQPSADAIWNSLVEGNQRFVSGKTAIKDNVERRQKLSKTQHPKVAVLSCSDSRVPPEAIFDQGLGDLFVVRVAGNSEDPLGVGSLEYAVEHLGTTVIVVLGHQSCGAVTAACSGAAAPTPALEAVVRPIAGSCSVAKKQGRPDNFVDLAIKDHVRQTAHELLTASPILKHAYDEGKLTIIDAFYSLDTGVVSRLP
jgi:carbonic anhydrase